MMCSNASALESNISGATGSDGRMAATSADGTESGEARRPLAGGVTVGSAYGPYFAVGEIGGASPPLLL